LLDSGRHMIILYDDVWEKLEKKRETEDPDQKKIRWYSNYILRNLAKEEFLTEYFPDLKLSIIGDDTVIIKDLKGQVAQVMLRKGKLWCDRHENSDCEHVHFALALPDIGLLIKKKVTV